MKRLLILAVLTTLLAPAAGCNCMNWFSRKNSCQSAPPVQAGCADGGYYAAPGAMAAPPADIYGPVPQ